MSRVFTGTTDELLYHTAALVVSGFNTDAVFTLLAWFKPVNLAPALNASIAGVHVGTNTNGSIAIEQGSTAGNGQIRYRNATSCTAAAPTLPSLGWNCLVGTKATGVTPASITAYLNDYTNSAAGTGSNAGNTSTWDRFSIGGAKMSTVNNPFEGKIAHVAAWNRVLSQSEIEQLMAGDAPSDIASGLVCYWPLTTTSLTDEVGSYVLTAEVTTPAFDGADNPTVGVTAPALTDPTAVSIGTTTVTPRVTTDTGNGTAYYVVTPQAEGEPTNLQVEAGTNATDTAPVASGSQVVSAAGVITFAEVTGLTAGTAYRISYVHSGTP